MRQEIDVLAAFDADSDIPRPVRFKIFENGIKKAVDVSEIINTEHLGAGGRTRIEYTCKSTGRNGGVLTSIIHMDWMRAVAGRLKSDYRYSKDIVYNNFPWPTPTEEQKARIVATTQGILEARAKYPDASLASLYDELLMPEELRKAHQANDKAVMAAYGIKPSDPAYTDEAARVALLMNMYQKLVEEE